MDVVDAIKIVPTQVNPKTSMPDWPVEDIIIESIEVIK